MRRPALLPVTLLAVLALGAIPAEARPIGEKAKQSRAEVVRYWTAERMRNATPADARRPLSKPAKGGGTSSVASVEVATPYPSAHGKVFFSDAGTNYVCSGTAVISANDSVVRTTGHCINEGPGGFYENFLFVPAYRDGAAPYGSFAAVRLHTTSGWQASGEWGVDLGAAVVGRNAANRTLGEAVAERPVVFGSTRKQPYAVYGYPAAKRFSGQRLRVCNTAWLMDDVAFPPTMGVSCDMTGGSSGGGWVTSTGAVASVVSYGYASLRNVLFGPHQGVEAQQLLAAAAAP